MVQIIREGWLLKMERSRPELCPVIMSEIQYEHIAEYMSQKKTKEGKYFSKTTYESIRSAFMHLFIMSDMTPPPGLRDKLTTLLKGFKRRIIEERVVAGESLDEGKDAMSFECYNLLCKKFFEGDKDEFIFAHTFLLLEWNLMARADNIVNLNVNDLEWDGDSLVVHMKRSKTDQEGANGKTGFHCYFNSLFPHLNLGLGLGMYLLSNPGILGNSTNKLFPAENQYHRYSTILKKVIIDNREEFEKIGVTPENIGSHSARKGAATLAAAGCTISPSMASICNRAGWKMGGTRDKYIKYESAGDQFLGRTLCGFSSLTKEFSLSPPFFNVSTGQLCGVYETIQKYVPEGMIIDSKMMEVLGFLVASIVYHLGDLEDKLHKSNRFRSNPMMTNQSEVRD